MSNRNSLLGNSHRGFQQIPEAAGGRSGGGDATIDIPLATVQTKSSGKGIKSPTAVLNEKEQQKQEQEQARQSGSAAAARPGRRRQQPRKLGEGEERVRTMGRLYERLLNFSIVTRYLLYILPMGAIIAVPIVIGATAAPEARMGGIKIVWIFAWVLTVWVGLWASKLFAKMLPSIFEFLCGIVSSGTEAKPEWINVVQRVLAAFLVSSLIFLAIKILIHLISISYHRMQYDMKIKESKHRVQMLCVLYDASTAWFPPYCPEFAEEDYLIQAMPDLGSRTTTAGGHAKTGTATPMKLLANVGRVGDQVTAAFGHIAHEVTGKEVFNATSSHSVVVEALEKRRSSEALAKRIWMSLVIEGRDALLPEDVAESLPEHRQREAAEVFQALDKDGNGDVSLDEMILSVCEIGRERHAIAASLHDVDQAINILENLLLTIAFVVCIFVFVAFLNTSFVTTLATAGTALLSLSFIFSATAAEILGSCIFLFVKHPFDVGDRVDIAGEPMVVERISLLYTVFKSVTNHRTRQAPNVVLNTVWIDNVSRSKAMRERLQLEISFDTTLEDVQLLKREMQNFVLDRDNSRDFEPDIDVEVTNISKMDRMELTIEIRHKSNWSNESVRAARRSKFMCALTLALRKIPIYAPAGGAAVLGSVDQPTYAVAVSDAEAAELRQKFADTKEGKRLKPSSPPADAPAPADAHKDAPKGGSTAVATGSSAGPAADAGALRNRGAAIGPSAETAALSQLNARSPLRDPAHDWQTGEGGNAAGAAMAAPGTRPAAAEDDPRGKDLEAVGNMLRRESTRGKRHHNHLPQQQQLQPGGAYAQQSSPPGVQGTWPSQSSQASSGSPPQPSQGSPPQFQTYAFQPTAPQPTIHEAPEGVERRDYSARPPASAAQQPSSFVPRARTDSLPGGQQQPSPAPKPRPIDPIAAAAGGDAHPGTRLPTPGGPGSTHPASAIVAAAAAASRAEAPLPPAPLQSRAGGGPPPAALGAVGTNTSSSRAAAGGPQAPYPLDTAFPAPPSSRHGRNSPGSAGGGRNSPIAGGRTTPTLSGGAGMGPAPYQRFPVVPLSEGPPAVRDRSGSVAGAGAGAGPGAGGRARKNSYAVEPYDGRGGR